MPDHFMIIESVGFDHPESGTDARKRMSSEERAHHLGFPAVCVVAMSGITVASGGLYGVSSFLPHLPRLWLVESALLAEPGRVFRPLFRAKRKT